MMWLRFWTCACVGWACVLIAGCASPAGGVQFEVPAGRYEEAIEAVRSTLADARFKVDRVDAAGGVISTYPKPSAGLATPWDTEQASFGSEVSDLVNQQERVARVTFEGAGGDLRRAGGPLSALVEVVVYRVRRSGWRVETESISRSTHSVDPLATQRGTPPRFSQPIRRDDGFARALAARFEAALGVQAGEHSETEDAAAGSE